MYNRNNNAMTNDISTDLDVVYKKQLKYFDDNVNSNKEELSLLLQYILRYGKLIQLVQA